MVTSEMTSTNRSGGVDLAASVVNIDGSGNGTGLARAEEVTSLKEWRRKRTPAPQEWLTLLERQP
jgi:glutamate synthase domain-containing protein 2